MTQLAKPSPTTIVISGLRPRSQPRRHVKYTIYIIARYLSGRRREARRSCRRLFIDGGILSSSHFLKDFHILIPAITADGIFVLKIRLRLVR